MKSRQADCPLIRRQMLLWVHWYLMTFPSWHAVIAALPMHSGLKVVAIHDLALLSSHAVMLMPSVVRQAKVMNKSAIFFVFIRLLNTKEGAVE